MVFTDCQMHFFKYLFKKKGDLFLFSYVILLNLCQRSTVIGLLLRHYQRLRETAKNDNCALEIGVLQHIVDKRWLELKYLAAVNSETNSNALKKYEYRKAKWFSKHSHYALWIDVFTLILLSMSLSIYTGLDNNTA